MATLTAPGAEPHDVELTALKADLDSGLASCEQEDMVTGHEAFSYLAHEYGFHLVGITGIAPDAEASPARLASETGAQVLVLDPVEGLTDASAGDD